MIQILSQEFPEMDEGCLQLLLHGIAKLTKSNIIEASGSQSDQYIPIIDESWHLGFASREVYYREMLKIWPIVLITQVKEESKDKSSFDDYLEVYRDSGFGIFLSNTKMLTSIYPGLKSDWEGCYDTWIAENTRILSTYSGLSFEETQHGIGQANNEIILHPEKYHNDPGLFKKLIKRHYRLMLTEHNC